MSVGEFIRGRASPRLAQRLADDRSGNVAIVFALTLMVLVQAAGGAVDYGRCLNARSQMQTALDAAVLAAGRVLQTSGGDQSAALRAARQYYDQLRSRLSASDGASFAVTGGGTAVEGVSSATIPTPFLHAMGIADLLVSASAKAVLEAGGNAGTSLEIALMLDITGSMAGQKIADLKLAAMDLINTVVWADQGTYSSRVAIAPFAARVSAAGYGTAVTGLPAAQTFFGQPRKLIQCVTERTGADALTDEAPENGRYVSAYMGDAGAAAAANPGNYSSSGVCYDPSASATVMPLTSDRAALKAHVDGLRAGRRRAGPVPIAS